MRVISRTLLPRQELGTLVCSLHLEHFSYASGLSLARHGLLTWSEGRRDKLQLPRITGQKECRTTTHPSHSINVLIANQPSQGGGSLEYIDIHATIETSSTPCTPSFFPPQTQKHVDGETKPITHLNQYLGIPRCATPHSKKSPFSLSKGLPNLIYPSGHGRESPCHPATPPWLTKSRQVITCTRKPASCGP
jgi:hypothetical protein